MPKEVFLFGGEKREVEKPKETGLDLRQEGSVDNREKQPDGFEPAQRRFEPFLNQEFKEEDLFVNNYGGNYAQKMELNRRRVERALKIAHLDGRVFLTTIAPSRSRSEAQGNELAAKRFLLFERKTQKVEEENPYKRVVSVPEGWRIEINDQRLTEELTERKLSGKELQITFINRFNGQVKDALKECVWREKCSSEKDPHFRYKLFWSGIQGVGPFIPSALRLIMEPQLTVSLFISFGVTFLVYGMGNVLGELWKRQSRNSENILRKMNPNYKPRGFYRSRNIDHAWEYLMPYVEVDKVGRTYVYTLAGKGRKLVREVGEKQQLAV